MFEVTKKEGSLGEGMIMVNFECSCGHQAIRKVVPNVSVFQCAQCGVLFKQSGGRVNQNEAARNPCVKTI